MSGNQATPVANPWDHYLRSLWRRKDGSVWKTVAVIDRPAVTVENVETGERETHVIGSLNYAEFERLRPEDEA